MRHIPSRLICLTLALLALLAPCAANADSADIVFRSRPSVAFRDPYSLEIYNKGAGRTAVCGQHTYSMPELVQESIAQDYIGKAETVLEALADLGAVDRPLTIHLSTASLTPRVEDDTLYISMQDFRSMAYVTALTQLAFGVQVNYGLVYAVSCDVAAALGLSVEEALPLDSALPAFRGDGILYADMNYACFIAPYTDEQMQACVKALARDFASTLTAEEKRALLTGYTNEQFYRRLNQYLLAHNLPLRRNQSLWNVSFYSGGPTVHLCWETDLARFAVDCEFEDFYGADWYATEEPLVSSYADLIYWVEHFDGMLSFLQARFAPFVIAEKPLIIFDTDNTGLLASYHAYYTDGYYDPKTHTIRAGACEVVDHEYVHALVADTSVNEDMNEVLAYSYANVWTTPDWSYDLYDFSYEYAWRSDKSYEGYDPDWSSLQLTAVKHLGHMPDYFELEDVLVMIDIVTSRRGHATAANLTANYCHTIDMQGAKISYWRYLVSTYGEDAALRAALTDDPLTHLNADWDTLTSNWITWLTTTY